MVLFSFSIPQHIPLILSGQKAQTTRIPRKPRKNGAKPYSVGELAQLYYRSRQAKDCNNCVNLKCPAPIPLNMADCTACLEHSNFFGESVITGIYHYSEQDHIDMCDETHTALLGDEIWVGHTIGHFDDEIRDKWAILDGFPKGWDEANDFFLKSTGDPEWMYRNLDVIKWNGQQIARRVA